MQAQLNKQLNTELQQMKENNVSKLSTYVFTGYIYK